MASSNYFITFLEMESYLEKLPLRKIVSLLTADAKTPFMNTHVLKRMALLEWIDRRQAAAVVHWRACRPMGWREIQPRWRILNNRVHFQFQAGGRRWAFWLSSARSTKRGVKLLLASSRKSLMEGLDVTWKADAEQESALGRYDARALVSEWVKGRFTGYRVAQLTQRLDRAHSLSGAYLRVLLCRGESLCLVLILESCGREDTASGALTQALLWLNHIYQRQKRKKVVRICLIVPTPDVPPLQHRALFLNADRVKVEVLEYAKRGPKGIEIKQPVSPRPPVENRDFCWPVLGPFRWNPLLARVVDLAPASIRRYPRFHQYDTLRLWGLEFARASGPERDQITYGVGAKRAELNEDRFEDLRSLVQEILYYRRPDTPDPEHTFYRLQSERWLEALILEEVQRLFPELVAESIYSQIPVYLENSSGRVDILAIDRSGTLVVMELKVTEDPDLPLQAVDYWGRVIHHNEDGDFDRRGYFSGMNLTRTRPRIYLISPVFSFHDSTESILRFLDPKIEVWKISVNEDWRCGVKILRRIRIRCGDLK
jgi:hypothetical protein